MTGSKPCPRERDNSHGFGVPAFQWLTAWSVKMELSDQRGVERVSNQLGWVLPANIRVPRSSPLLKRTFSPPGRNMIFHNVVSCSSQLMSQSIMSHLGIGLTQLPVIEPPAGLVGPTGMFSRFREGPSQVLVAVSDIARPLILSLLIHWLLTFRQ